VTVPTYHDLHVTTPKIPRMSIFNLAYGLEVSCSRVTGWTLTDGKRVLAGEYDDQWLVLDVDGHVICDGRVAFEDDDEDDEPAGRQAPA
jgi:hypothetical protein